MARLRQSEGSSSNNYATPSTSYAAPSGSKGFTQRPLIVERSGPGGVGRRVTVLQQTDDAATQEHFSANSRAMEARAVEASRDALFWTTRLSDGPVDRRLFREAATSLKPSAYRDILTERHVNGNCAYPPCHRASRKPWNDDKPVYRMNIRAKRVLDVTAGTKFCSETCARRSAWYETYCLSSDNIIDSSTTPMISTISQPVQLLEDVEEHPLSETSSSPQNHDNPPAVVRPAQTNIIQPTPPNASQLNDSYAQMADDFLSRLNVIERNPMSAPRPPTSTTQPDETPDELEASYSSSAIMPFDMQPLQREIVSAQGQLRGVPRVEPAIHARSEETANPNQGQSGTANVRRVEIDVQAGYESYMDTGWELFKQLRSGGEL